ncbi:unnamed protein product [Calypogeia fissa]
MGKPFVACRESDAQSPSSSPREVSTHNGKLDSGGATNPTESTPQQGGGGAAESFQQLRRSSSRQLNSRKGPSRTLLEMFQAEEEATDTEIAPTPHLKSIVEVLQMDINSSKKAPAAALQSTMISPEVQGDMLELEASTPMSEFSLDNSVNSPPRESMFSPEFSPPSEKLGSVTISPAPSTADMDTPSEFSLDDSDNGAHDPMWSTPMASGPDVPHRVQNSVEPFQLEGSQDGEVEKNDLQDGAVSKSEFAWNAVPRRSARSLDLTTTRRSPRRMSSKSSTSPRFSLSDEAISERTAAWGTGVAKLVMKNSSQGSTPRTSTASSIDGGFQCGQKIPGFSKHIKDAISSVQLAFVVCDVIDPERPVLFASAGFFDMTGYSPEEVIGRNCRFLQGVDTDAKEVARISTALKKGEAYSGTILNYKKNGSPFWNQLTLSPITDDTGVVIKYMGMQAEVTCNVMTARRPKKTMAVVDTNFNDGHMCPLTVSQSITEEMSTQPSSPSPSKRSEREDGVPIFTLPTSSYDTARVTASGHDSNGRSQGSKRYSLTYGTNYHHARTKSVDVLPGRAIGGSERFSTPSDRKRSLAPQQKPAKCNSARPFYWLMTAARILEQEMQHLESSQSLAKDRSETMSKHQEERKSFNTTKENKISLMAKGVLGLFRKLERKVFKRQTVRASGRVNAYDYSDSDVDIDDFQDIGNINDIYFKDDRQNTRCESMPHISSSANLGVQPDLRSRSNRFFSSAALEFRSSDHRKSFAPDGSEFLLDRKQFCIVHE